MFYKLSFLNEYKIRFDETIHYTEDKIFSMQCMYLADDIRLYPKILYFYRENLNSAMHKRLTGIKYYQPLIDAYIRSDILMKKYQNRKRGILREGHVLAQIYLMDMIDEHYENSGSKKDMDGFLNSRELYQKLLRSHSNKYAASRYYRYLKNSKDYIFRMKIHGALKHMRSSLLRKPVIVDLADKVKYSTPVNDNLENL